jgi:GNAT superfamily N-acetyltransferase
MLFADRALAERLEAAEGYACTQFAAARQRVHPETDSTWLKCAGADVVFDGIDAPTTQTFGLGLFEQLTAADLDAIEEFFQTRGAVPMHEVCPFADLNTLDFLCARGYRPFEISNVLFRTIDPNAAPLPAGITVRVVNKSEAQLWSAVNARGWAHDHPEFEDFLKSTGALLVARENSPCFLAELDGTPAAAGSLSIYKGVALFAGAATAPEHRRRGLQGALLAERMRFAADHGCDLAMMVAEAGSNSQRNAERQGFRIAYTRLKWKLVANSISPTQ